MHFSPDEEEKSLVKRCLAGDRRAWDRFFDAHYRTISSIVAWKKWHFDSAEREEVIQDILEAVIKSLKGFEFKSRVNTFVYRISVSSCIAHLRKKTTLKRGSGVWSISLDDARRDSEEREIDEESGVTKNPESLLIHNESIAAVRKALAKLEERCRDLIRLRYFEDLSFKEIAERTGAKENTLVVMLRRCLFKLLEFVEATG